jgi:hypothetical protein
VQTVLLLLISWAAGMAAYGVALLVLRGEVLSLDNWMVIGSITLVAWLVASLLIIVPTLRLLLSRRSVVSRKRLYALTGAALAIVPVWLNIGFWYGWDPRQLLIAEAGFLGVHYATSGLVLSLALARRAAPLEPGRG